MMPIAPSMPEKERHETYSENATRDLDIVFAL
jgi:hypothetical protein